MLTYFAFVKQDGDTFLTYLPDLSIYDEGKTEEEAIKMTTEAAMLSIKNILECNDNIPEPSSKEEALNMAEEDADDIFDYSKDSKCVEIVAAVNYDRV